MLDGVIACIDDGWFCTEIADAAYEFQSKIASGRWVQVGVNGFTDGDDHQPATLYVDPAVEDRQLADLARVKQRRNDEAVRRSLERIRLDAVDPTINLMPAFIEAAGSHTTVGECMGALESIFGTWFERSFG